MTVFERDARAFLELRRLAVIGASDDPKKFGNTIYKELKAHGYDVVPVNPSAATVDGDRCLADIADVVPTPDGAVVMVNASAALDVVERCAAAGVGRVWLFRGVGAPGAMSDAVLERCRELQLEVVPGACPLMFLEPVAWFHRLHRGVRHANRSLVKAS